MAGLGNAPTLIKVVSLLEIIALIVDVIGFSTAHWTNGRYYHSGLWNICPYLYAGGCLSMKGQQGWFEAVQAFETLGFIAGIVALILIILYVFVPATSGKKIVSILSMLAAFAAAGCIILGIIIYGAKASHLSWSFALCTVGGVLFGVAGLLLAIDMLKR